MLARNPHANGPSTRAAISLASKYYGYIGFKNATEEINIFILLKQDVCTETVWNIIDAEEDPEVIKRLKNIEYTPLATKSPKKKLEICRSRETGLYEK